MKGAWRRVRRWQGIAWLRRALSYLGALGLRMTYADGGVLLLALLAGWGLAHPHELKQWVTQNPLHVLQGIFGVDRPPNSDWKLTDMVDALVSPMFFVGLWGAFLLIVLRVAVAVLALPKTIQTRDPVAFKNTWDDLDARLSAQRLHAHLQEALPAEETLAAPPHRRRL